MGQDFVAPLEEDAERTVDRRVTGQCGPAIRIQSTLLGDGTGGGDNSYVAPAPAPYYGGGGGGGGDWSDDGGGSDG